MKTSKRHSQEIMREIRIRQSRAETVKKRTLKTSVFAVAIGLLLPATVYASAGKKSSPFSDTPALSEDIEKDEPFTPPAQAPLA